MEPSERRARLTAQAPLLKRWMVFKPAASGACIHSGVGREEADEVTATARQIVEARRLCIVHVLPLVTTR